MLCGKDGLRMESLYSNGFTFDISPIDKGGLFGSKERDWDFFDEFLLGTGPEFSVLLADHPYTELLKNNIDVIRAQKMIFSGETEVVGQITNYKSRMFYPWNALLWSPMQFIGEFRYDGYSSQDGWHINNVVFDSKSMKSLFYHLTKAEPRRSENKHLGNTYQFYIWSSMK